ncbi:MAG: amidohydrolase [Aerococcaceae bacterium]|nr:amidohydrolase [Aerococcaceae bacterium]
MSELLFKWIDAHKEPYIEMADYIFDHPELGNQEFEAMKLLTDQLKAIGFEVEVGIAGLETAFKAVYRKGTGQPNIGLLCEYDALEGLGHACGHHMQGPSIVLAAEAIVNHVQADNFQITVYGTPAEETTHGKLRMLEQDYMKELDVALMMHGSPTTTTDIKSLALTNLEVTFLGKSAHAALKPEDGRSAFDALLLAFNGTEFLREHVREDVKMHYTMLETTGPANVVPARARAKFSLRSYSRAYLNEVEARVENVLKGAAMMAGVECEINWGDRLNNKIPALKLNELLMEKAQLAGAPRISPPREKTGSSDFSNVMYEVPGSCIRVAFVPVGTSSHSQAFLDNGKTEEGHVAIEMAAKVLSAASIDLITQPDYLAEIKAEFDQNKATMQ